MSVRLSDTFNHDQNNACGSDRGKRRILNDCRRLHRSMHSITMNGRQSRSPEQIALIIVFVVLVVLRLLGLLGN